MNRRILLALALVLALAATQLTGCDGPGARGGTRKKMTVVISIKEVEPGLSKQFHVGETVRVKDTGSVIGKIVSTEGEPSVDAVPTAEGELVASPIPNLEDVFLTIEGDAVEREDGFRFDGEPIWVNQDVKLLSRFVFATGRVQAISEAAK